MIADTALSRAWSALRRVLARRDGVILGADGAPLLDDCDAMVKAYSGRASALTLGSIGGGAPPLRSPRAAGMAYDGKLHAILSPVPGSKDLPTL